MNIDLKSIEAFVHIMRSGSMTRAEHLTGISKATLSRHIARLEEELGTQLLLRNSRRVTATQAGHTYFAHCENLLTEVAGRLASAHTDVQELAAGVSGTLSVLSESQFGTTFVCSVVKLFLDTHPTLRCQLSVAHRADVPRLDDVDCYVCENPPDLPNLVGKLLGRLSYGLYASPQYLARRKMPLSPEQLDGHDAIVLQDAAMPTELLLSNGVDSHVFKQQQAFLTNDHWVMKTFCINGFGVALLPDFFCRPEVQQGVLVPVLPDWKTEPRRIYCTFQKQRYMGRKLRSFVDLMARCVADIDTFNSYVSTLPARAI